MACSILQTCVPAYRLPVFDALASALHGDFRVVAGDRFFDPSLRTVAHERPWFQPCHNCFLGGGRLLWQSGPAMRDLARGPLVVEANPRCLRTWLLLGEARRRGVPTAVWGHALGRQVASNKMAALRRRMFAMAETIICYCYAEQGPLQKLFPGKHILVAGNFTVCIEECAPLETSFGQRNSVLFLGRLVEAKKPILLLKAVHLAQQRGIQIGATFVGDGPQLDKCERFVAAHRVKGVLFSGAQFEREKLRSLASSCFVMASPGYVGLSVLDAMSCGLPVAYSPSEPNSPEVEVLQDGGNALAFASDSAESLVDCLLRFYADRDGWLSRGEHYVEEVRSKYSIERMTKQFIRFFRQDGRKLKKLC